MTDDRDTEAAGGDDPIQAGLEQFQRAALDAVRAARTMLEAAESMLQEPATIEAIANTVNAFARTASETLSGFAAGGWPDPSGHRTSGSGDADQGDTSDEDPGDGVERISVE